MRRTLLLFCCPSSLSLLRGAGLNPAPPKRILICGGGQVAFRVPQIPELRETDSSADRLAAPTTLFSIGYVSPPA